MQSHQERFNLIEQLFLYSRNLEAAPALLTHPGINRQDLYPYSDRINQIGAQHVMVGPAVLIARVIPTYASVAIGEKVEKNLFYIFM